MSKELLRKFLPFVGVALGLLALALTVAPSHAGSIVYVTPAGATESGGNPVQAEADFTTSAGSLTITLKDLFVNPKTVAQLLSDLSFTVGNGGSLTGASLASSSGQEITVAANGTFTTGSTVPTGWVPTLSGTSGLLDVLNGPGHAGPAHTIIGPPDGGGTYSNANNSIAGNGLIIRSSIRAHHSRSLERESALTRRSPQCFSPSVQPRGIWCKAKPFLSRPR